jgi:hypothetical protein
VRLFSLASHRHLSCQRTTQNMSQVQTEENFTRKLTNSSLLCTDSNRYRKGSWVTGRYYIISFMTMHQTNERQDPLNFQSTLDNCLIHGCLELLHNLCSTNFIVEQLYKNLEFTEYLFRCFNNFTLFSRIECVKLKPIN